MAEFFDASPYVRAPVITVRSGLSLARALIDACPTNPKPPANVVKACKYLKKTADDARNKLAERNRLLGTFSDEDTRILDNEADRAWAALRMRLTALSMLPQDVYPRAKVAAELDFKLFRDGTAFLKADYGVQNSSMAALLQRIDDDELAPALDDVAGAEFLKAVRSVQPRYEAMVSERLRRDKVAGQSFVELTRALQAAIVNYATKIIGTIEHDEPKTAEAARVALLPIMNYRESSTARDAARAARGGVEEAAPEEGEGEASTEAEEEIEPTDEESAAPAEEEEEAAKPAAKAAKPAAKAAKPAAKAAKPAAKSAKSAAAKKNNKKKSG